MELDENMPILIADDNEFSRTVLHATLRSFGFVNILEADNGLKAMEMGLESHPRFAFLDIYMPEMDGWGVVKRFKKELPATILIMVSASRDMVDIDEAIGTGVDGYFFKPFQHDLLLAEMTRLNKEKQDKSPAG